MNTSFGANSGQSDAHYATVQFLATVTYKPATGHETDPLPTSIDVPYRLINYASSSVNLAGMTPLGGSGQGYASVANALANTGTISRGTSAVSSSFVAGPLSQDKSATRSVPLDKWTDNGDGTSTTYVILESNVLTTRARIDAYGSGSTTIGPGGTSVGPTPDESASGGIAQSITDVPKKN